MGTFRNLLWSKKGTGNLYEKIFLYHIGKAFPTKIKLHFACFLSRCMAFLPNKSHHIRTYKKDIRQTRSGNFDTHFVNRSENILSLFCQ